jgi:hypothetical protein
MSKPLFATPAREPEQARRSSARVVPSEMPAGVNHAHVLKPSQARQKGGGGLTKEVGKIQMGKLAGIGRQLAELDARRAELVAAQADIFEALAEGQTIDPRTLRKSKARHQPVLGPVSDLDRARARSVLRDTDIRRRLGT